MHRSAPPARAAWNRRASSALATADGEAKSFQARVQPWLMECFGEMIAGDRGERNHRFFEEAGELVQACGMSASEAHQLVDYVWNRPMGEKHQEVGGVMITLAALCLANGLDMHDAAETELARIWTKVEAIRAKQAAKPKHSPLPVAVAAPQSQEEKAVASEGERAYVIAALVAAGHVSRSNVDEAFSLARKYAPRPAAQDDLTAAVERTIETLNRQIDLIAERAPGQYLDKIPVVRSLHAHARRLTAAIAKEKHDGAAQ